MGASEAEADVTNPEERERLLEEARAEVHEEEQQKREYLSTKARLEQQYEERRVTIEIGEERDDVEPIPVEFQPLDGEDSRAVTELTMRMLSMGDHETVEDVLGEIWDIDDTVSELLAEYSVDDELDAAFWAGQYKLEERVDILKQVSNEAEVDEGEVKNLLGLT